MKFTLIFFLFFCLNAFAQFQTNNPTNIFTKSGKYFDWTDTTNIFQSNNKYTTCSLTKGVSDIIILNNFNFNIPQGAYITGIQVNIERDANGLYIKDKTLKLTKNSYSPIGENKAKLQYWTSKEETIHYGDSFDLWLEDFTIDDINSNKFGIMLRIKKNISSNISIAKIDNINITVYYQLPLPIDLLYFNAIQGENLIALTWSTLSEYNSDYFLLLKSLDGTHYDTISTLKAAGYSSLINVYSYKDYPKKSETYYYKLIQYDYNGNKYEYNTIAIPYKHNVDKFKVYPSISNGLFYISYYEYGLYKIYLINTKGDIVFTRVYYISTQDGIIAIDLRDKIVPGLYNLYGKNKHNIIEGKLIIK